MLQNAFLGFFTNAKIFLKALRADRVSKGVFLTYVIEVLQLLGAGPSKFKEGWQTQWGGAPLRQRASLEFGPLIFLENAFSQPYFDPRV